MAKPARKPPTADARLWPADRVQRLKVADLLPYARNARLHTSEQVGQLAAAMQEFGVTNPVIVDEDGEIVAGHGRVLAAQRNRYDELPGVRLRPGEWTPEQKRAYRIWDNQSALLSEWSPELLKLELRDLQMAGYPLEMTGFPEESLVTFLANPQAPQPPGAFPAVGEDVETEFCCPRCRYRWSGNPAAGREE